MKARKKGTNDPFQKVASVCLCSGGYILIKDVEFEQEPNTSDYWQDLRERAAIAAMNAFCVSPASGAKNITLGQMAQHVVKVADALVKELKGE